jgi:hypothetical protein
LTFQHYAPNTFRHFSMMHIMQHVLKLQGNVFVPAGIICNLNSSPVARLERETFLSSLLLSTLSQSVPRMVGDAL